MTKKLGFWSIVLLGINSIIGTGIFLSPGSVIAISGNNAPLVYFLAAVFAAILATSFAAAAKYVNKGGAAYAYATAAFGKHVGFYTGVTRFLAAGIAWGVFSTGLVKLTLTVFGGDATNKLFVTLGLFILMAVLFLVNLCGQKILTLIGNLSTLGKLLALVITIVIGAVMVIKTGTHHFGTAHLTTGSGQAVPTQMTVTTFVAAIITAFYAFTGFESTASGSDDMESPEKNLPRAIPLAVLAVAAVYIGIIVIVMMLNPQAVLSTHNVVGLAEIFTNPIAKNIVLYGALISMFGINVAAAFSGPRVLESMAKQKQIPAYFNHRTANGIPMRAFLVTALIAIIVPMSFQYDMADIMIISSISRFFQFIVVPLALMTMYFGRHAGEIATNVYRNVFTDVIVPVISLFLTVFLLVKFNWSGQFVKAAPAGDTTINYVAIGVLILGYVILPVLLYVLRPKAKNTR